MFFLAATPLLLTKFIEIGADTESSAECTLAFARWEVLRHKLHSCKEIVKFPSFEEELITAWRFAGRAIERRANGGPEAANVLKALS